jgi:hypothetical protein
MSVPPKDLFRSMKWLLWIFIAFILLTMAFGEHRQLRLKRSQRYPIHRHRHRQARSSIDPYIINGRIACCVKCTRSCACCYASK